ncbi:TetR family transcriptional regulator [Pseudodesulfovibrio sp. JC047]|uniref:TetR/AcrR family transcriptional regulator n=1 Tax=Pseudodesulfovibrio sp. JC047 TaxID=2683199 RepID=UPI0013D84F2E|nr:TetR family transcriptional regulator [Pseudodesulfovibrio sp. JC047]NDV19895.1 TetR family transcriptional regulator [Pseudodesulfovibrio sp. JC047]
MNKKEHILTVATKLFAKRTYDTVGIRDIARKADVNSAMVSYYFGSKSGLLREIFSRFTDLFMSEARRCMNISDTPETLIENFVPRILANARTNRDLYLVGLRELNHDSEELQDLRDELIASAQANYEDNIDRLKIKRPRLDGTPGLGFTVIIGAVFSDYLLGGGSCIDDEERVEEYSNAIIEILQKGLPGYWQ